MIRSHRNPWLSVGIHIDHRAPYVAFHLPGVRIEIGRCNEPVYSRSIHPNLWALSEGRISDATLERLRAALGFPHEETDNDRPG